MDDKRVQGEKYLTCEKYYIFELLICTAGMMGAYTYNMRGGVFCNAQTANVVLMAIAFGKGRLRGGIYYLIPISAYVLGTMISEALPKKVRKVHLLRWDTYLIGFEIIVLFLIGWMPITWPVQIVQVLINFICSMQYNTFRQAEGIPMATTFITNHLRQAGVWLTRAVDKKEHEAWSMAWKHFRMVFVFCLGGFLLTLCCGLLRERSIWIAILPLAFSFGVMFRADRGNERRKLDQKPHGH